MIFTGKVSVRVPMKFEMKTPIKPKTIVDYLTTHKATLLLPSDSSPNSQILVESMKMIQQSKPE